MVVFLQEDAILGDFTLSSFEGPRPRKFKACFDRIKHGIVLLKLFNVLPHGFWEYFWTGEHNFREALESVKSFVVTHLR